MLYFIIKGN